MTTTRTPRRPMPQDAHDIEHVIRHQLNAYNHELAHADVHAWHGTGVVFLRDLPGIGARDYRAALEQLPWACDVADGYGGAALVVTRHDVDDVHITYERGLDYAQNWEDEA